MKFDDHSKGDWSMSLIILPGRGSNSVTGEYLWCRKANILEGFWGSDNIGQRVGMGWVVLGDFFRGRNQ